MQEVGELSPAVSPVKSPTGGETAFASLAQDEEDAAARAGDAADSVPSAAADGSGGTEHVDLAPQAPVEASSHGLQGGSADGAVANGGPAHAASGELEGFEHLHSPAQAAAPSTAGGDSDAAAAVDIGHVANTGVSAAASLEADAAMQEADPAQQPSARAAGPARTPGLIKFEGEPLVSGAIYSTDTRGHLASNGINGHMARETAPSEVNSAGMQNGTSQARPSTEPTQRGSAASATEPLLSPRLERLAAAAAQEQQFTCKVCDITTSSEAHMQVRSRAVALLGLSHVPRPFTAPSSKLTTSHDISPKPTTLHALPLSHRR